MGDTGSGLGDGVRASGLSGMWPTDLRRLAAAACADLVAACSLCLSPCREEGRGWNWPAAAAAAAAAGELGTDDDGEDELDESLWLSLGPGRGEAPGSHETDRFRDEKLRLGVSIGELVAICGERGGRSESGSQRDRSHADSWPTH